MYRLSPPRIALRPLQGAKGASRRGSGGPELCSSLDSRLRGNDVPVRVNFAKAGAQSCAPAWIPAFAGMTSQLGSPSRERGPESLSSIDSRLRGNDVAIGVAPTEALPSPIPPRTPAPLRSPALRSVQRGAPVPSVSAPLRASPGDRPPRPSPFTPLRVSPGDRAPRPSAHPKG